MDAENEIEFWLQKKTTYKFIEPFAVDLSAPASQAFVERIFSLHVRFDDSRSHKPHRKNHWK